LKLVIVAVQAGQ